MSQLPIAFVEQMKELLGDAEAAKLFASLDQEPPKSIRWNRRKALPEHRLKYQPNQPIAWCQSAHYIPSNHPFTGDPLWHSGYYYVQEASSMLLAQIQPLLQPNTLALDLCAAPGGKSTLLLDILPEGSALLSNEYIPHRANILAENLQKWGARNSVVTNATPAQLGSLNGLFDLVVIDAPCSGEGMFRKDLNARSEWTPSSPQMCAERQRSIINDIMPSLKDGGLLVYSTCTLNTVENEEMVTHLVEHYGLSSLALPLADELGMRSAYSCHPCYRLMPHRHRGEGFFLCVLRKEKADRDTTYKVSEKLRQQFAKLCVKVPDHVAGWLRSADSYKFLEYNDSLWAISAELLPLAQALVPSKIRVLTLGVPLAEKKGKDYAPHPALAYSEAFDMAQFETFDIGWEDSVRYLSRISINLPSGHTSGYKLLCTDNVPVGFVKYLGNRSNSLYPNEWRIRHPEKVLARWRGEDISVEDADE